MTKYSTKILLTLGMIFLISGMTSSPVSADDCQIEWWKRNHIDTHEVQYYGKVKPGTAKTIFVEVWGDKGMTGTGLNFVNPRGSFSVFVTSGPGAKLKMKKSSKPIFSCSMDNFLNEGK